MNQQIPSKNLKNNRILKNTEKILHFVPNIFSQQWLRAQIIIGSLYQYLATNILMKKGPLL